MLSDSLEKMGILQNTKIDRFTCYSCVRKRGTIPRRSMSTPVKAVGIREFRENIAGYADSNTSMAITRHGMTLGYYIPVKRSPTEADKVALQEATQRLHTLLEVIQKI
jgi:hypothetical protein